MKIYLVILIIFSLLCGLNVLSDDGVEERKVALLKIIDEELVEISRLNKQNRSNNPTILLRMAELLLEKARLIKESENKKYLSESVDTRRKTNKSSYFNNSKKYFVKAQKVCFFILKKFPRLNKKTEIYYILGANAQEFQKYKEAKNFYARALKGSTGNELLKIKTQIALAEMHYNDGEYKPAIKLYESALSEHDDKWWTKDAYNLSWSYFKEKKYQKAIEVMKQVHDKSGSDKYIDVSDRAARDLGYFYSTAGNPNQAAEFYKKSGKDVGENLLKVGQHLISYGKYAAAEKTLAQAVTTLEDENMQLQANIALVDLYDRSGNYSSHLVTCKKLKPFMQNKKLNEDQEKQYLFQLKKISAILQNQVAAKTYGHDKAKQTQKANMAVGYFEILKEVDSSKAYLYEFTIAETLFASERFDEAIEYYDSAAQKATAANDTKIAELAGKGLIVSLDQKGVSSEKKKKFTVQVFNNYLKNNPKSDEAFKIYQRLFTSNMEKKDIAEAEKTLLMFRKHFPYAHAKQEAMLAAIMDYYKANKDRDNFSRWVEKIKRNEFIVNNKYAAQLNKISLAMQFENVQGLMSKGDKKKALVTYVAIYKDKDSSSEEKKYAAYNIMLLFNELRDVKRTVNWAERALQLMDDKDVAKFDTSFLAIGNEMFNRRKFNESVFVYEKTLLKICKTNSVKKKTFFKNAYIMYLADQKIEEVRNLIRQTALCEIPQDLIDQANVEALQSLVELKRWNSVEDQVGIMEKSPVLQAELIEPVYKLRNELLQNSRTEKAQEFKKKIFSYFATAKKLKYQVPLKGLDVVAAFKVEDLNVEIRKFKEITPIFPEDKYNALLQNKFVQLKKLTDEALEVLSIGSGKGLVRAYKVLIENYLTIITDMREFTPPGKSADYVASFKKSMYDLSRDLEKRSNEFAVEARRQIISNDILSNENYLFLNTAKMPIQLEYIYTPGGVLMDRGGRK
ncbi:MAG: hypothetical protein A2202_07425 [Bdellovibrionales bacterium RIFOXYA1_FULL_36_14]|nr:MAG: hypothetical protein A2202_07425 [Bdellovibrionales bacterium RIFOXYA1_FULL_36_14]